MKLLVLTDAVLEELFEYGANDYIDSLAFEVDIPAGIQDEGKALEACQEIHHHANT
jgi:hypothetical protein